MANDIKEKQENLLSLINELVKREAQIRAEFQIGDKFKFIRERLLSLQIQVEENLKCVTAEVEKQTSQVAEGEALVFVYLYNANGLIFNSWQKMLSPAVLYEYSVNRPIYQERAHIEAFIRNKPNRAQHAYLVMVVKSQEILPAKEDAVSADSNGNPLIKIQEGSLRIEKLVAFIHNEHEYTIGPDGALVRKI